ncbi:transposase [Ancylothrix sp. D3o]|uniref:IS110 family transposase n=1 Tax=Ancylothrix sp. D3o TaxID=2953691 RepID=UPI0021BAAACC|nr:transposase [Ancylothrix sp. D3o]
MFGLDSGRGTAVFCWSDFKPIDPDEFKNTTIYQSVQADTAGLNEFLTRKIDGRNIIILEPTGKDGRLWLQVLKMHGFEVLAVSNNILRAYAESVLFWRNKTDQDDAAALMIYGWDKLLNPRAFIKQKDPQIQKLHDLYLQHQRATKDLTAHINQGKAQLVIEWPEKKAIESDCQANGDWPLFWAFVAGGYSPETMTQKRHFTTYRKALTQTVGSGKHGFTDYLQKKALAICISSSEKWQIEREIGDALRCPEFEKYLRVFKTRFGFGDVHCAILLSQLYPFEQFLNDSGSPLRTTKRNNTESGKPSRQNKGERLFHARLGFAPYQRSSGQKSGLNTDGSTYARSALWIWVYSRIEPNTSYEFTNKAGEKVQRINHGCLTNDIGNYLRERLQREKAGVPAQVQELEKTLETLFDDFETAQDFLDYCRKTKNPKVKLLGECLERTAKASQVRKLNKTAKSKLKGSIKGSLNRIAQSRCCSKAVKLLFKELVKEWRNQPNPT